MEIISTINLCSKVPISLEHQIDFYSEDEQKSYFSSKTVRTIDNCKYTPRSGELFIKGYVDELEQCNYGYYTNVFNGTAKTYYFFIIRKDLVSKGTTKLTIAIDVFQTWFFQFTPYIQKCFIEREHVADDSFGLNTIAENIDVGELVANETLTFEPLQGDIAYIIAFSTIENGSTFGKILSGYTYRIYLKSDKLVEFVKELCDNGQADCIGFIATFPLEMLDGNNCESGGLIFDKNSDYIKLGQTTSQNENIYMFRHLFDITPLSGKTFTFNNSTYTPKNNKMFCYPYNFIKIENDNGSEIALKFENFNGKYYHCYVDGMLQQNPIFSLSPKNYNGREIDYSDTISCGGFPLCSWNNDNYSSWYAQNSNRIKNTIMTARHNAQVNTSVAIRNARNNLQNLDMQNTANIGKAVIGTAGTLASGNVIGAVSNVGNTAIDMIANNAITKNNLNNDVRNTQLLQKTSMQNNINAIMAEICDEQIQPNTCRGDTTLQGLDMLRGSNTFFASRFSVKPHIAKLIDNYFSRYGYRVNKFAFPQFVSRETYNYIKTLDMRIVGSNIPREDIDVICAMFDNGLTVWHDMENVLNYDVENNIVIEKR